MGQHALWRDSPRAECRTAAPSHRQAERRGGGGFYAHENRHFIRPASLAGAALRRRRRIIIVPIWIVPRYRNAALASIILHLAWIFFQRRESFPTNRANWNGRFSARAPVLDVNGLPGRSDRYSVYSFNAREIARDSMLAGINDTATSPTNQK